ncbi:MAG: hypothetical protein UZ12_BCD005001984, partial [Bacteroidetes bacterium OLB12]
MKDYYKTLEIDIKTRLKTKKMPAAQMAHL